jgi:perosamine synthetase
MSEDFIPVSEPFLRGNEKKYVMDCLETTWISSLGKYVKLFEEEFAKFCGCSYGASVCNGTVALQLALSVLGIKPGDEVVVPSLTFVATANAVHHLGAKPVFVDSENETWTIDPGFIEKKITPKTKAIIPVHVYGHPANMDPIMEIAEKHNLFVVEDAAEAHGATYKGKKVGSIGHVGCFSFYGNKIITTGEGGMCVTNDEKLYEALQFAKDHCMGYEKRYWHPKIGFNFRMTNIQAAIGVAQLEQISSILAKRERDEQLYKKLLKGVGSITPQPRASWAKPVYWMHSVLFEDSFGVSRDEVMKKLKEKKIDSRPFFYPNHLLPPYNTEEKLAVCEEIARKGINLPSSTGLSEEKIRRVCNALKEIKNG